MGAARAPSASRQVGEAADRGEGLQAARRDVKREQAAGARAATQRLRDQAISWANRSAIATVVRCVFAFGRSGITDASHTRSPS